MSSLIEYLRKEDVCLPSCCLLDVGARKGADRPPYAPLFKLPELNVFLIDGDSSAALEYASDASSVITSDKIVADGTERRWFDCLQPSLSSIFEPNENISDLYDGYRNRLSISETRTVVTSTLDEVTSGWDFDFIKSDIQGADLVAFQYGTKALSRALLVDVEVEFVEQYRAQPRFSEVELFLRAQGFQFHRFREFGSRPMKSRQQAGLGISYVSQWLWGNAVFFRDPKFWPTLDDEKLLLLSVILWDCYSSFDAAVFALEILDRRLDCSFVELVRANIPETS